MRDKSIYLTNYPTEYFLPNFSEERREELVRIMNNLVCPKLDDGTTITNFYRNPETGYIFFLTDGEIEKKDSYMLQHHQRAIFNQALTDEEFERCKSLGYERWSQEREDRRFEKAKKLTESEWDGWVVYDDTFYYNIDDFREIYPENSREYDEDGVEWPKYVYATIEKYSLYSEDLSNALENILENNVNNLEDSEYLTDIKIPDYLQEVWDRFVVENRGSYYEQDDETVILLNQDYVQE